MGLYDKREKLDFLEGEPYSLILENVCAIVLKSEERISDTLNIVFCKSEITIFSVFG